LCKEDADGRFEVFVYADVRLFIIDVANGIAFKIFECYRSIAHFKPDENLDSLAFIDVSVSMTFVKLLFLFVEKSGM
jgi:hypothetical protein